MQGLTNHARTRSRQRCLGPAIIELVLRYGHRRQDHGDELYEIRDRDLLGTPFEKKADRLRGASVVLTRDGDIRTVKWQYRLRHRPGLLRGSRSREGWMA